MTIDEARRLAQQLTAAADAAEAAGYDSVDLLEHLAADDDAARAELEAALRRAQG